MLYEVSGLTFTEDEKTVLREGKMDLGLSLTEQVRSKRINLEGNTHTQEINVSQCPV
jgi:hypothetical protein